LGRYRRTGASHPTDLVLYVLLPVLMFTSLVRNPLSATAAGQYVAWYSAYVLCAWAITYLAAALLGWDRPTRSAMALAMTGLNCGSYGVPVVLFALGDQALSGAMLLTACSNITAGSIGVYLAAGGTRSSLQALGSVFRLPLVYALALALAVHTWGVSIPPRLLEMGHLVGMAGPTIALVVLGIQLSAIAGRGANLRLVAAGTAAKLVLGPALGIGLALALGAEGLTRQTLLIYSCMPTAINGLLLAVRFQARPDLLGGILVGTTLLSPLAVTAVLAWLGVG
ncbi:MAG: AEC family transporter, partial [Gemmatimonadota bacterium]